MLWSSPYYIIIWVQFFQFHTTLFLTSQRTRMSHTCNIFISFLILLLGDIQSNPVPVSRVFSLNLCTLNIRSIFTKPLHYTTIADLADTHNIDVFALTETLDLSEHYLCSTIWCYIPRVFTFINTPRLAVPDPCTYSIFGGGTEFLLREPCKLLSTLTATFKSFVLSSVTIKLPHSNVAVYLHLYRPPQSTIPNLGILCLSLSF